MSVENYSYSRQVFFKLCLNDYSHWDRLSKNKIEKEILHFKLSIIYWYKQSHVVCQKVQLQKYGCVNFAFIAFSMRTKLSMQTLMYSVNYLNVIANWMASNHYLTP